MRKSVGPQVLVGERRGERGGEREEREATEGGGCTETNELDVEGIEL